MPSSTKHFFIASLVHFILNAFIRTFRPSASGSDVFCDTLVLSCVNNRLPQYLSFPYAPIVGADVGIGPYGGASINDPFQESPFRSRKKETSISQGKFRSHERLCSLPTVYAISPPVVNLHNPKNFFVHPSFLLHACTAWHLFISVPDRPPGAYHRSV